MRGSLKDKAAAAVSICLRNCGPHLIGRYVWHFISPAISVVPDSVAIDTTIANHISTTRFVSDSTMNLLVCILTSLQSHEEAIAGNHWHVKLNLRWVLTLH